MSVERNRLNLKYTYLLQMVLMVFVFGLIISANYKNLWIPLILSILFLLAMVLSHYFLFDNKSVNIIFYCVQLLIIYAQAFFFLGYGSIIMLIILHIDISFKYKKKAVLPFTVLGYLIFIGIFYLSPVRGTQSIYIGLFISVAYVLLMTLQSEIMRLLVSQSDYQNKINELTANKKTLRDLNRKMQSYNDEMEKVAILKERSRMSKQIHDTLGHTLTAVIVQLGAAEALIEERPAEAMDKVRNAKAQAKEGFSRVKDALSLIDENNIQFAEMIQDTIDKAKASMGIHIISQVNINDNISFPTQRFLLSALEEGITNGVRHGKASAFVFRLTVSDGDICFFLEDNGNGCSDIKTGYGLMSLEKHAMEFGGSLKTYSMAGKGFVVDIVLPAGEEEI